MARKSSPESEQKKVGYALDVEPDDPDIRDHIYHPSLTPLHRELLGPKDPQLMDQGAEGGNVAFALSASINRMCELRGQRFTASPRMLERMAYRFFAQRVSSDNYGASCRDAIRGWAAMGVCAESEWPYVADKPGSFTIAAAKNAKAL